MLPSCAFHFILLQRRLQWLNGDMLYPVPMLSTISTSHSGIYCHWHRESIDCLATKPTQTLLCLLPPPSAPPPLPPPRSSLTRLSDLRPEIAILVKPLLDEAVLSSRGNGRALTVPTHRQQSSRHPPQPPSPLFHWPKLTSSCPIPLLLSALPSSSSWPAPAHHVEQAKAMVGPPSLVVVKQQMHVSNKDAGKADCLGLLPIHFIDTHFGRHLTDNKLLEAVQLTELLTPRLVARQSSLSHTHR